MTDWPSADASTTNVDSGTDNPRLARADIDDAFTKLNAIIQSPAPYATRADVALATVHSSVNLIRTHGYTTRGDGGGALYNRVALEPSHDHKVQSGDGSWFEGVYEGFVTPEMFDTSDDDAAWNSALTYLGSVGNPGGRMVCMAGAAYSFNAQVTLSGDDIEVWGNGATISTSGAISALKITGDRNYVNGLRVDHTADASATYGIEINGGIHNTLEDCKVYARDNDSAYEGITVRNSDLAVSSAGAFWTRLINCTVTWLSSGTKIPVGIGLIGNPNQTIVQNCQLGNCTQAILIEEGTASGIIGNGMVIMGTAFESCTTGIDVVSGTFNLPPYGLVVAFNRFESITTGIDLSDSNAGNEPLVVWPNYWTTTTTKISNPNGVVLNNLDEGNLILKQDGGANHPLTIRADGSRGVRFEEADGTLRGQIVVDSANNLLKLLGAATNSVELGGIRSLSATTTQAKNLRGSATFATSGTVSVTFGTAESDSTYFVAISGDANETFWVTSKGTGGFTLNSSNASSTATVDWVLVR